MLILYNIQILKKQTQENDLYDNILVVINPNGYLNDELSL